MEVINETSFSVFCVEPRAVFVLRLENKIQISFSDFPVSGIGKNVRSAGQQKSSVGVCIHYANGLFGIGRVGTGRSAWRSWNIFIVDHRMLCGRVHDLKPFICLIYFPRLFEGFVHIRHRGYERGSSFNCAAYCFPIERISPTPVTVATAARLLEHFEEMNRSREIAFLLQELQQKG